MFSLTKLFAGQLNSFTKVFSVPGRAQQASQLQEMNYSSDWVVWLLFLRAMPSFLPINYESAFGFLFHKPDTAGVNLGTIAYATPKSPFFTKLAEKLPAWKLGSGTDAFFLMLEDEMKKILSFPTITLQKRVLSINCCSKQLFSAIAWQAGNRKDTQTTVSEGRQVSYKDLNRRVWEQIFGFSWEESMNSFPAAGLLNE